MGEILRRGGHVVAVYRGYGPSRWAVDDGAVAFELDGEGTECGVVQFVRPVWLHLVSPWVRLRRGRVAGVCKSAAFAGGGAGEDVFGEALGGGGGGAGVHDGDVGGRGGVCGGVEGLEGGKLGEDACEEADGFLGVAHWRGVGGWRSYEVELGDGENAWLCGVVTLDEELVHYALDAVVPGEIGLC